MQPGLNVIVVGAYGGIGRAVCRLLHLAGARLAVFGRDQHTVASLAESLDALPLVGDASSFADMDTAMERATAELGPLAGAVNCAGSLLLKPAHLTTESEYAATVSANLTTAFALCHAAGKTMTEGGSVVLVSTAAARAGIANHEAIAAAKGGVQGLMLSAAATYATRGLRFNCVAPGLTRTPLAAKILANEASEKASLAMHALGRLGEPDDVARAICWLLDPANDWVTGQVLGVDGGLANVRVRPKGSPG
jgi:NAD(P)-dependent dehydrogenase (short-subunit alcohol dehydrogenase family)